MIRNLKVFGLALVAMLALGSMAASAASAHTAGAYTSNSTTGKTWITGTNEGQHTFSVGGLTIHCTTATNSGTVLGNSTTQITVTASYSGCSVTILGFNLSTTVNMGNCAYKFTEPKTGPAAGQTGGTTVDLVDHGGDCTTTPVSFHVSNFAGTCNTTVKEQAELHHAVFHGTASTSHDVTVTATVTGIHAETSGGLCPEGTKTYTNGTYTGNSTVQGWRDDGGATIEEKNPVDIWVDHTES